MYNDVGFELLYPPNCKELTEDLRIEELRKRINDINNALHEIIKQNECNDESIDDSGVTNNVSRNSPRNVLKYSGLFVYLLSPQFVHHIDMDIKLRVGLALCRLLTLFCPKNPFENASNSQCIIKDLLLFMNECISHASKLHSKHDVHYPRLHTIIYTCCKLDVLTWCRLLDDGDKILLLSLKTIFGLLSNISVWAWSDVNTMQQFILDTSAVLLHQTSHLYSDEIITYLLKFLIEPARSTLPCQHTLAKDLILRSAPKLEYPIQLLLQNSLVKSDQTVSIDNNELLGCYNASPNENHDPLGEHTFTMIYALHTLQESIVAPILPCVELKLKSLIPSERKRAFRLLARIFAEPNSTVHQNNRDLWTSFLTRFNDIDSGVLSLCIQMVPFMLKNNPELPKLELLGPLQSLTLIRSDSIRLLALKTLASLTRDAKEEELVEKFCTVMQFRARDRSLAVRKEALAELAHMYKRDLLAGKTISPRMSEALNATLHMYYQPSNEDKIAIERLFKSCIIPYNMETKERVQSLFTCYQLADDAAIKSIQELLKVQFTAASLMRDALTIIVDNLGMKIVGEASKEMMERLQKISTLLPNSEKSIDCLKRFFNAVHNDRFLRINLAQLLHPKCSSVQAAQCLRDILKRIGQPTAGIAVGTGGSSAVTSQKAVAADASYEHTVKLLLERCASVLFDEAFGQELLTQLVVTRETLDNSAISTETQVSGVSVELSKSMRILLALAVYHKDILPVDDVLTYLQSVLSHYAACNTCTDMEKASGDPSTPTELALQILCCMLGGGPIYGSSDAGGAGAVIDGHLASVAVKDMLTPDTKHAKKRQQQPSKKRPAKSWMVKLYTGSATQLFNDTKTLLPLLKLFCTTGMSADYPPLPLDSSSSETNTAFVPTATRKKGGKTKSNKPMAVSSASNSQSLAEPSSKIPDIVNSEALSGLAWRRERRRAKLAVRVLRQLLTVVHSLAGSRSFYPKGPVSSLEPTTSNAEEDVAPIEDDNVVNDNDHSVDLDSEQKNIDKDEKDPSNVEQLADTEDVVVLPDVEDYDDSPQMAELEKLVQLTLDDIVKTCLSCDMGSSDYVTALTVLSHISLLFPGVYNRQLKSLMSVHLISELLTKDVFPNATTTNLAAAKSRKTLPTTSGTAADWTKDGHLSVHTRAKIAAVKLMANWLVGLKLQNKQVAQVIIRLLHRIIVHDGDLTSNGRISFGEMSRMRLVAATSWLKIAHFHFYVDAIEVEWYQSMSYVLCDPCPEVRSHFLSVLHQGLLRLKLPLEYMAMFVHVADVVDNVFRQRAKQFLVANVKRRRDFLNRHSSFNSNPKMLFALLPDFVLVYAIHLLAHDPDWTDLNDTKHLSNVKGSLWFILEPLMSGGNSYSFLRRLLELMKHSKDALCPDDETTNEKIYIACDIALGLLLTRSTNIMWKSCQIEIKLPRTLFIRAPPTFYNPDFAQLCKPDPAASGDTNKASVGTGDTDGEPRLTFTPVKNARAVKDGLIPSKFLRSAATPGDASSNTSNSRKRRPKKVTVGVSKKAKSDMAIANGGHNVDLDDTEDNDGETNQVPVEKDEEESKEERDMSPAVSNKNVSNDKSPIDEKVLKDVRKKRAQTGVSSSSPSLTEGRTKNATSKNTTKRCRQKLAIEDKGYDLGVSRGSLSNDAEDGNKKQIRRNYHQLNASNTSSAAQSPNSGSKLKQGKLNFGGQASTGKVGKTSEKAASIRSATNVRKPAQTLTKSTAVTSTRSRPVSSRRLASERSG